MVEIEKREWEGWMKMKKEREIERGRERERGKKRGREKEGERERKNKRKGDFDFAPFTFQCFCILISLQFILHKAFFLHVGVTVTSVQYEVGNRLQIQNILRE